MNLFLNQLLNRWFPAQHFKVKRSKKKFKVQLRDISPSEKENSIFSKHETMFYWWKHTYHRVQTRKNIDLDGEPTDHIFPIKKTALVWLDHSVIAISRNNFFFPMCIHPNQIYMQPTSPPCWKSTPFLKTMKAERPISRLKALRQQIWEPQHQTQGVTWMVLSKVVCMSSIYIKVADCKLLGHFGLHN